MTINIGNLAAASFMPGLQNSGQVTTTAYISGSLNGSPSYPSNTSNLVNPIDANNNPIPIIVQLPDISVISQFSVNFPYASGDLASKWFPMAGTGEFYDYTQNWECILYEFSHPEGRAFYFNILNMVAGPITFTGSGGAQPFAINITGHLFSYPWAQ